MKCLSIYIEQDANMSLYNSDNNFFRYIKSETLSGNKHDSATWPLVNEILKENFVPDYIVISFADTQHYKEDKSLYGYYENISALSEEIPENFINYLEQYVNFFNKLNMDRIPIYWVSHNYSHILSSTLFNNKNFEYGISIDNDGPDGSNKLIVKNPLDIDNCTVLHSDKSYLNSMSNVILDIAQKMNLKIPKLDYTQKILEAQLYGNVECDCVIDFIRSNFDTDTKYAIRKHFDQQLEQIPEPYNLKNQKFLNAIATIFKIWEQQVLYLLEKFIHSQYSYVIYSGEFAQNPYSNTHFLKQYPNIDITPSCGDEGISLGGIAFFINKHKLNPINTTKRFPFIHSDFTVEEPSEETIVTVAELLSLGKTVGWYQGNGEIGKRSLGNRSILMSPLLASSKEIISKTTNKEPWRFFDGSILQEYAEDWFYDIAENKYMLLSLHVQRNKRHLIPGIINHKNQTITQTIDESDNPIYRKLIKEFFELTGIPVLLNSPLSTENKPMAASPQKAIEIYSKSDMQALCIGDTVFQK